MKKIIVAKLSYWSGKVNYMALPITFAEYMRFQKYIQDVFPHLNATEREFLLQGTSAEEQDEMYGTKEQNEIQGSEDFLNEH